MDNIFQDLRIVESPIQRSVVGIADVLITQSMNPRTGLMGMTLITVGMSRIFSSGDAESAAKDLIRAARIAELWDKDKGSKGIEILKG